MAWYNSLRDLGHGLGGALKNPIVDAGLAAGGMFLGIPPTATMAATQGLGNLMAPGGNLGKAAVGAGTGALEGYTGGKALSALGGLGGGGADAWQAAHGAGGAGSGFLSTLEGAGKSALGALAGGGQQGDGGIGGFLGNLGHDALGFLTGNGGMNALGTAGAINAALLQNKANQYAKNALGMQTQAYNERAPLRTGGIQAMQSAMAANPYSGVGMPQRQPNALGMNPAMRAVTLAGGIPR